MATLAGIVRVSHVGRRDKNSAAFHADQDQVDALTRYCEAQGVRLELMPPEVDVSGGLPLEQRPALLAAVEGVERGEFAGIIVAYLSRLGRNTREMLRVWDRVESAGGRIVTVRENLDTSTPAGRLHRNMLLSIDEHQREQHAEDHDKRRERATADGIWQNRMIPLGYRKDAKTRKLTPGRKQDQACWAFRAITTGTTLKEIARKVGMTTSGVRYMLRNRVYLGELHMGKYMNATAHPALVTVEEFEAAQVALKNNPRAARRHDAPALLAGLAVCAGCGHRMTRSSRAYTCHKDHSGASCPAPAAVTERLLDAHVSAIAVGELERLSVTRRDGATTERKRAELAVAEAELAAYLEAVSAADVGVEAFKAAAHKRRDAVEAARAELRAELAREPALPAVESGDEAWEMLDGHERNRLLRALLSGVVVQRAGGRGARVPIEQRVRVLAFGAELPALNGRGGAPAGIRRVELPDADHPGVLRPSGGENGPKLAGSVGQV
jgi:DNA invertase Pin-like site-specific DNA recombinase